MQSYAMFITKKGRPKSEKKIVCVKKTNEDTDVIQSLFYLKKITKDQYDAAKLYNALCARYYSSIEAPSYSTSSFEVNPMNGGRTRNASSSHDTIICKHWLNMKTILCKISHECDLVLYKVVIEGKMKYELLNPTNLTKNHLKILHYGLDAVRNYCASNTDIATLVQ